MCQSVSHRRTGGSLLPVIRTCSHCGTQNRIPAKFLASMGRCGSCKSPLPPIAEPLAADEQLFDEIVKTSPVPVLVGFWRGWGRPCLSAAPEVARTAANMAGKAVGLKRDPAKDSQLGR